MRPAELIGSPVSVRCAEWTVERAVDPIGSAGRYDTMVLVETPAPWPSDVASLPGFAEAAAARPHTLILAVAASDENVHDALVTVYRRRSLTQLRGTDLLVDRRRLAVELARIVLDARCDDEGSPAPPDAVVCGHGRRDRCCGRLGVRLEVAARDRPRDVRLRRCSHLGGHRFAPTAMTMADGRMWAHLDETSLDLLDGRLPTAADLTRHYRGSTALEPWAQAAEREIVMRLGAQWPTCNLEQVCSTAAGDDSWAVQLRWRTPDGSRSRATVNVRAGGSIPTPVCGQPIDAAVKSSREYIVSDVTNG